MNTEDQQVKRAVHQDYFHGESWYTCPWCGKAFEYYDAIYCDNTNFANKGITRVGSDVYRCSCGNMFRMS